MFRPIEMNGMVTRSQDLTTVKQNEVMKPVADQHNFQTHMKKEISQNLKKVRDADETENQPYRYDAKEKGNGKYEGRQKKREKKEEEHEDKVVIPQHRSFDIKI